MMLLRKIGVYMAFLLFLLFVITGASIIRLAGRNAEILLLGFSCSSSHEHIISALQEKQISRLFSLELALDTNYFSNLIVNLINQSEGGMK